MAEINEEQLYDALGVQAEEAPEAAEASDVSEDTEPAVEAEEDGGSEEAAEQTPDERHANAARRRQQEQQAAIEKAVKEALDAERESAASRQKSFFEKAKLKNSITGEAITNMDEFDAWEKAYSEAKVQRSLRSGNMTVDDLNAMIAENPTVKAAQGILDQQKQAAERAQREANEAQARAEIEEIGKFDPSIKSVEDLARMPNSKQFYDYVMKGLSFKDAYYLTNRERMDAATVDAARNAAANKARGKEHLSATASSRGTGAMSVPQQELAMFKLMNPTATPEQIQAYYNNYRKK